MKEKLYWLALLFFLGINAIAYIQAYKFSHFTGSIQIKTSKPEALSFWDKAKIAFTGISNPKPQNNALPALPFKTIKINTHHNYVLEAWKVEVKGANGTVILFHGYTGKKSDLIEASNEFSNMGFNTLLVDFYGSGGSSGNGSTLGYNESVDVLNAYKYVHSTDSNIYLFGSSMGAVSILRAVSEFSLEPKALILECPYGSLLGTVKNRFELMGYPSLGLSELLVFWGGVQNGYWGFSLNSIEFAEKITTPTLIMHGAKDKRAKLGGVKKIYTNLKGEKRLKLFKNSEHESYLKENQEEWIKECRSFIYDFSKKN